MRHASLSAIALAVLVAGPVLADAPMQGCAPVERGSIFYEVTGKGGAVVLIHGG